jgi:hypothetical protein
MDADFFRYFTPLFLTLMIHQQAVCTLNEADLGMRKVPKIVFTRKGYKQHCNKREDTPTSRTCPVSQKRH